MIKTNDKAGILALCHLHDRATAGMNAAGTVCDAGFAGMKKHSCLSSVKACVRLHPAAADCTHSRFADIFEWPFHAPEALAEWYERHAAHG